MYSELATSQIYTCLPLRKVPQKFLTKRSRRRRERVRARLSVTLLRLHVLLQRVPVDDRVVVVERASEVHAVEHARVAKVCRRDAAENARQCLAGIVGEQRISKANGYAGRGVCRGERWKGGQGWRRSSLPGG